jgi:hypothetical protein
MKGVQVKPGLLIFKGIKRGASVAVLHAVVSGECVLLLIGGAHVAGQSRDRVSAWIEQRVVMKSLTDVWPSLKCLHNSKVLLRPSVSSPYCP